MGFFDEVTRRFSDINYNVVTKGPFSYFNILNIPDRYFNHVNTMLNEYVVSTQTAPIGCICLYTRSMTLRDWPEELEKGSNARKLTRSVDFSVPEYEEVDS
jgi:hypothetical protein